MSDAGTTVASKENKQTPTTSPTHEPLQPSPASATVSDFRRLHDKAGNQAVGRLLNPDKGNEFVENLSSTPGILIQRQHQKGSPPPAEPNSLTDTRPEETTAPRFIVEDGEEATQPGQMRKSEFLGLLKPAVCAAAEEALAGTMWSAMGCPYIERWFSYYAKQSGRHVERALRKFIPESGQARSAEDYIPMASDRVRRGVAEWAETGRVSGVPDQIIQQGMAGVSASDLLGGAISLAGSALTGLASGIGGALSSAGGMLFKERSGNAAKQGDPGAVQAQLGTGQPLQTGVRTRMESAFGVNFAHVRVHRDADAAQLSDTLNARAFTVGNNVAFGTGEYRPGTPVGDALIAHELAHVLQQRNGLSTSSAISEKGTYNLLEQDADTAAAGVVVRMWAGAKGSLAEIGRNALPRLRSGLALQRCSKSEREKEIERLGGLQYGFLEEKRKKKEEEERKRLEEEAKKRGEVEPKIEPKVTMDDVLEEEVKKSGFTTHPTDKWDKLSPDDKKKWQEDAKKAWDGVIASIKGTELEKVMKGKSYKFSPREALEKGYYAWQDKNKLNFGMPWVTNALADPKNAWPNLAHEMGGHFEYGKTYASEIMNAAIEKMPEAERKAWQRDEEKRRQFYLTYEYPETEIFAALRELRYAVPESGPKPTYGGLHPHLNIPKRLKVMKDALHPEVAKAVLQELQRRINASPEILERDKKYFLEQVKLTFGYSL